MDPCFSEENLKWLRTYLRETKSHSLLIVTNERTIFKYGDIKDMFIGKRPWNGEGLTLRDMDTLNRRFVAAGHAVEYSDLNESFIDCLVGSCFEYFSN